MAVKTYSYSKDKNTKLSSNFTVKEFACIDDYGKLITDVVKVDTKLVEYLQNIRNHFNKPVNITSSYRPEPYNASIGGAYGSYHTLGKACDFYISGVNVEEIAKYAETLGILGIGCYKDDLFVHIDTRTVKFFWYNQSNIETYSFGGKVETALEKKVKVIQNWLNRHYKSGLNIDGQYGAKTKSAIVKAGQYMLGLKRTGKADAQFIKKYPRVKTGDKSAYVALVQAVVICNGIDCTFDGTWGSITTEALKKFQTKSKITSDGILGENTITKLFG